MGCGLRKPSKKSSNLPQQAMNLNSLPDELLVGILKYGKRKLVSDLRKQNRRIDAITRRYDVGRRIPVAELTIYYQPSRDSFIGRVELEFDDRTWKFFDLPIKEEFKKSNCLRIYLCSPILLKRVEFFLNVLRVQNFFCILVHAVPKANQLISLINKEKQCYRNTESLAFNLLNSNMYSKEILLNIFLNCKRLHSFECNGFNDADILCNTQILGRRKWKNLAIRYNRDNGSPILSKVDKEFLNKVVKNCEKFSLYGYNLLPTNLTALDCLKFIQESHKNINFADHTWHLSLHSLGNLSAKLIERLNSMCGFTYTLTTTTYTFKGSFLGTNLPYDICRIKIPTRSDAAIHLYLERNAGDPVYP